eukprot:15472381-Alexandrium_andersonii.AAC.1
MATVLNCQPSWVSAACVRNRAFWRWAPVVSASHFPVLVATRSNGRLAHCTSRWSAPLRAIM